MPSIRDPIPSHCKAYRLVSIHVKDKFSRFFTVPEFEVGIVKSGWRGVVVESSPTADVIHIENDAQTVFQRLCARYGPEVVQRYHPGPERLAEDMERYASATAAWMKTAVEAEEAEERKRIAADRASRLAQAEAAQQAESDKAAVADKAAAHAADLAAKAAADRLHATSKKA
jgi:hypothetical protein